MSIARAAAVALLVACAAASPAVSAPFAVVYSDHMLFLIPPGSTITTVTGDFMLFVNKSGAPLPATELAGLKISAVPLAATVHVQTPITLPAALSPLGADEAIGALGSSGGGFDQRLLPGETLRDLAPGSMFRLRIDPGTYPSPVTCEFTVQLGADVAVFTAHLHLIQGSDDVTYMTSARTSSSRAVASRSTAWGRLKALYR